LTRLAHTVGFVALYLALDAVSFIHPLLGLNITPWNPHPALGLVYLLRGRRQAWISFTFAVVLSECVVRGIPQSWWSSLASALVLAGGYIALGAILKRTLPTTTLLDERSALLRWIVPVVICTLANSLIYLSALLLFGLLPAEEWQAGVVQFWIGDAVGIAVAMPLLWWLTSERGRALLRAALRRAETFGYSLLGLAVLTVAFGLSESNSIRMFYLLFLPIVWASARQGMVGAIISATQIQLGIIALVQILDYSAVTVAELQLLSLIMALIGYFIGSVVDEQRRTSEELHQTFRLAAAGEMAGALAHELNQPLTALSAYAATCEALLARGETGERLNAAIRGMLFETERTGEVVRRLRDFFRTGATKLEPIAISEIVASAVRPYVPKAQSANIELEVGAMPNVTLLADRLQIEVVIRNLLSNAFDAVARENATAGRISVRADRLPGQQISISVTDSGPGLSAGDVARLFEPFRTTKASGLGLGLAISRAIVETHGGSLTGEIADHGIFRVSLPLLETATNA
jgi:signal transduction histidine kinase